MKEIYISDVFGSYGEQSSCDLASLKNSHEKIKNLGWKDAEYLFGKMAYSISDINKIKFPVNIWGYEYKSFDEIFSRLGISKGYLLEVLDGDLEIIESKILEVYRGFTIHHKMKEYKNLYDIACKLGSSEGMLLVYLKRGFSLDEAIVAVTNLVNESKRRLEEDREELEELKARETKASEEVESNKFGALTPDKVNLNWSSIRDIVVFSNGTPFRQMCKGQEVVILAIVYMYGVEKGSWDKVVYFVPADSFNSNMFDDWKSCSLVLPIEVGTLNPFTDVDR